MFSDEGIGVHLCRYIEKKYKFFSKIHSLDFVDGGTLAQILIPVIAQYEYVLILDCVDANDGEIGDVYFFDFENVPNSISWHGSAHEVEMLQTLKMMDILGDRPTTKIVGIIPKVVAETTFNLTNKIVEGSKTMERVLVRHLAELGFEVQVVNEHLDIQDVANISFKGKVE